MLNYPTIVIKTNTNNNAYLTKYYSTYLAFFIADYILTRQKSMSPIFPPIVLEKTSYWVGELRPSPPVEAEAAGYGTIQPPYHPSGATSPLTYVGVLSVGPGHLHADLPFWLRNASKAERVEAREEFGFTVAILKTLFTDGTRI